MRAPCGVQALKKQSVQAAARRRKWIERAYHIQHLPAIIQDLWGQLLLLKLGLRLERGRAHIHVFIHDDRVIVSSDGRDSGLR